MEEKLVNTTSLYTLISDDDALAEAQRGDRAFVDYLMKKYSYLVRFKSRKYFLMGAEHEDVVQEGMIGLYNAILDYDIGKGTSFKVFSEICITRQIITAINTHNRQKHSPLNGYKSIYEPIYKEWPDYTLINTLTKGTSEDPEWIYITAEEKSEMMKVVKEVSTDLEYKVLGFYMEGKSYEEIGKCLGKSGKSADNAIQRVKGKALKYRDGKSIL